MLADPKDEVVLVQEAIVPPNDAAAETAKAPTEAPAQAVSTVRAVVTAQSEPAPSPSATEEPTAPPPRAEEPTVVHRQSQKQLAVLEEMTLVLEGLADVDDAFRALMAAHGLTPARLAAALVLTQSAYAAVGVRRQADSAVALTAARQRAAWHHSRTAVVAFRQVARTIIQDEAGRIALAIDERLPYAHVAFATTVTEGLDGAEIEPYATLLAGAGYDAERIAELRALLAAFTLLATQHRAAQKAAERATAARDAAVNEVRVALRQIKAEVVALLRRYPHLSTPTSF